MRTLITILILATTTSAASGKSHSSGSSHVAGHSQSHSSHSSGHTHTAIHRSHAATDAFKRETGYPNGRPGYVIDHIVPLKRGGSDTPANMQWQTIADARAKDKIE